MKRQPLLEMLGQYTPLNATDAACRDRFVDFVQRHPLCFQRELVVGHVTGAAWIVDAAGGRVLLTHHRKLDRWLQPGGHADGDPDVAAVALREAVEETGLAGLVRDGEGIFDLDIHVIPARGEAPRHEHYDVRFALRATDCERYIVSAESHDLAWVPMAKLEAYTREPSILRMRTKWEMRTKAGPV